MRKFFFVAGLVLLLAACVPHYIIGEVPVEGDLPDSNLTPGVVDSRVTQENVNETICVSGYTKTVRPSSSVSRRLKGTVMRMYGLSLADPAGYEGDHLISLEIGGSPDDIGNYWPEKYDSPFGARVKDRLENKLHDLVCRGILPLRQAQDEEAQNWILAYHKYVD